MNESSWALNAGSTAPPWVRRARPRRSSPSRSRRAVMDETPNCSSSSATVTDPVTRRRSTMAARRASASRARGSDVFGLMLSPPQTNRKHQNRTPTSCQAPRTNTGRHGRARVVGVRVRGVASDATRAAVASFPRVIVDPEVAEALRAGRGVVALESTLIAHGLPAPDNLRVAREAEAAVRGVGRGPGDDRGRRRDGADRPRRRRAGGDRPRRRRRQGAASATSRRPSHGASTRRRRSPRPRTSPRGRGSACSRPAASAACTAARARRGTSRPTSRRSRGRGSSSCAPG